MRRIFLFGLVCTVLMDLPARAANFVWTQLSGGSASGSWANQTDWSGGTLPTTSTDTASFNTLDLTAGSTITLDGNQTINSLVFGDANPATGANWFLIPGSPSSSILTLAGTSPTITVTNLASGDAAVISALITGAAGLTKLGGSYLQLTAANTYSGTTILNGSGAMLSFANDQAFGSSKIQMGVNGSGQVWFQPAGNRTLANAFEIQTIRWIIDGNTAAGIAAGDLTINNSVYLNQGGSNVRDVYCNRNLTINGPVTSTGALNKQGGFQLTLNGTNSFPTGINVNGGTLAINGPVTSATTVTVNSGTVITGTGTIAGTVSALGGTVQPGNFGSLTSSFGGLVLNSASTLYYQLGGTNNATNGFINVNGNLTLAGSLQIADLGGFTSGSYTGIHYSGTLLSSTLTATVVPQGKTIAVLTNTPHYIIFQALNGALFPATNMSLPMDLASPLTLSWIQVPGAVAYDYYLGTLSNSVSAATISTPGIYQGRTSALTGVTAAALQPNTTYYWRFDGVGSTGTVTKGAVLSFTTGATEIDEMEDTWVATDALGRSLPLNADAGNLRTNRPIGIFYFLWHDTISNYGSGTNWDNTQWITAHPFAAPMNPWASNPIFQQFNATYYWGQPQLGYYSPTDPWALRRQLALLAHAGIDVLIFDYSNAVTYDTELTALCNMIRQMRFEGYDLNFKIVFLTHASSAATATYLYNNFYSQNKFSDLWFYWQGKPLILGYIDGIDSSDPAPSATVQNFFTWRTSWANVSALQYAWQWIDSVTPQSWGYDTRSDIPEEVSVADGGWADENLGRSYTNHVQPAYDGYHLPVARTQGQGLFFAEQMNYGLKYDPQFLFITGWNEWIAGSFAATTSVDPKLLGVTCPIGGYYFVDEYDEEYSRDIEPMLGGHTDNYYFQMAAQNRLRKGARPIPTPSAPVTINLAGGFNQWTSVGPAYYDPANDTVWRSYASSVPAQANYTNTTGRNDFTVLKVARDGDNLYFFAQCNSNLTAHTGSNWMVLFIDADQNHDTGWEGYDFAVNLSGVGAATTTLFHNASTTNGWSWTPVRGDIAYTVSGNQLMLAVPRASLGFGADPLTFDFHWADDFQTNDIADFGVDGDSAPDRRFNYRYQTQSTPPVTVLTDDFESGAQAGWGKSFAAGSRWSISGATSYSGTHAAQCNPLYGSANTALQTGFDASGESSFRVSFRYKLVNVTNSTGVNISYLGTNGWVAIRNLGRDQYYATGQAWSYNEQQNAWLYYTDVRHDIGTNAQFFTSGFNLKIDGQPLSSTAQSVWIDDFQITTVPNPGAAPKLSGVFNGGVLQLSWPSSYLGWQLQVLTNGFAGGGTNNWMNVSGVSSNSIQLPIDPGSPAAFFRLALPGQ